jgi:TPR repeat protein
MGVIMPTGHELYQIARNSYNGSIYRAKAFSKLKTIAEKDGANPPDINYYGICLSEGYGCDPDHKKALQQFERIVSQGASDPNFYFNAAIASKDLACQKARYFYQAVVCTKKETYRYEPLKMVNDVAFEELQKLANAKEPANLAAQELYNICLAYGYGCQANEAKKKELFSSKLDYMALSAITLALWDTKDKSTPNLSLEKYLLPLAKSKENSKLPGRSQWAFERLKERYEAKETANAETLFAYGQCLANGWGCRKDKSVAASVLYRAFKLGHDQALYEYLKIVELDDPALESFLKSVATEQAPLTLFTLANFYQKQNRQSEAHCYFYLTAKTKTAEIKEGGKKTLSELSYEALNSFLQKNKLLVTTCQILGYGTPAIATPSDMVLRELQQNLSKDASLASIMALYDLGYYLISKNKVDIGKEFLQAAIAKGHPLVLEAFHTKGYFYSFSEQGVAFQKQHFKAEAELLIEYSFALQAHCVSDKLWHKNTLLKALNVLEDVNKKFEEHELYSTLSPELQAEFAMQKKHANELLKKLDQTLPPEKLLEWQRELEALLNQEKLADAKQFLSEKPAELKVFYAEKLCSLGEKKADLSYIDAAIAVGKLDALLLGAKMAGRQENLEKELEYFEKLFQKLTSQANESMRPDEPNIKRLLPLWQAMLSYLVDRVEMLAGAVTSNKKGLRNELIKIFAQAVQPFCVLTASYPQYQSLVKQYSEQLKRVFREEGGLPEVKKAIELLGELKLLGGKSFFAKPQEIITTYYHKQAQGDDVNGLIASIKVIKPSFAEEDELSQQIIKVLSACESNKSNTEKLLDVISPLQLQALKKLYAAKHAQTFQYIEAEKFEQYKKTLKESAYTYAPHISKEADYLAQELLERLLSYPEEKAAELIDCLSEEKKANLEAKYKDEVKYAGVFKQMKTLTATVPVAVAAQAAAPEEEVAAAAPEEEVVAAAAPTNDIPSQTASRFGGQRAPVYGQPVSFHSTVFALLPASAPLEDQQGEAPVVPAEATKSPG